MATPERDSERQRGVRSEPQLPAADPDARRAMASAVGNQAFGALVARAAGGTPPGRALAAPADPLTTSRLARAVIARDGPDGGGGTAVAEPASPAAGGAGAWTAPLDLGVASDRQGAALICAHLAVEAADMVERGFEDEFRLLQEEAAGRRDQFRNGGATALTAGEVRELTEFGREFQQAHRDALRQIAGRVAGQFSAWRNPPLSDEDLFELREAVHDAFVASDEGRLGRLTELLEGLEDITGKIDDWIGYGARAASMVRRAQRLSQISEAVSGIHDRVEEVQDIVSLARDIGRLSGELGDGPAGVDDIARLEGGLGALDFVVGRFEVPGITQIWSGYILPAAQASLRGLRHVMSSVYRTERGREVMLFFQEHINDPEAPAIRQGPARHGTRDRHFPGGQPVLDFMWQVMRDEATSVPDDVEDYFVRYREEFNAGMDRGNRIETDSAWHNAWNLFTREESTNLLEWVTTNRREIWTRLYGGMPAPRG